ncbi:hypothetical protein GCM10012285_33150 [Streptomyces kronopolitis]|uniref:DUF397 domain-containing protein n=1 Tax=Streptomyces kronopolitis TaxID=1612435 RepID=A0ABQ2JL76_9ACTN|nr:hypothetical protein GCM10012285_33150 [Streptomyces kronopolitis]
MDSGKGIRSREFRRAGQYASPDGRDAQKCVTTGELRVREPGLFCAALRVRGPGERAAGLLPAPGPVRAVVYK